jgi:hypothetical protein
MSAAPPDVAAAAARVRQWLDGESPPQQPVGKVSDEQYRAMTPAQRLDYSRSFDQSQFLKNDAKR